MPFHLEVNDKKKVTPICWEEAKACEFVSIMNAWHKDINQLEIFALLTGMQLRTVEESNAEDLDAAVYQVAAFVFNEPQRFRALPVPNKIIVHGREISIPTKIEKLTISQNFHMRRYMAMSKNLECLIVKATAIYLQPLVDEMPFDLDSAKALEHDIGLMDLEDVFPIGFFLLKRLNNYGISGVSFSNLIRIVWTKTTLMMKRLRKPRAYRDYAALRKLV